MLSVLIFKNTRGTAAAAAAITILFFFFFFAKTEKNPIRSPPREPPQNRACCGWGNEAAGQMSYPGMCRRAIDHTVYSWLLSHRPYLQTATWLLDSWLGPAVAVSSLLPQHPPSFSCSFEVLLHLKFDTAPCLSWCLSVVLSLLFEHSLFTLWEQKLKDEFYRREIKKLAGNKRAELVSHIYIFLWFPPKARLYLLRAF